MSIAGSLNRSDGSTLAGAGRFTVERAIPGGTSFGSSPINNVSVDSFGIVPGTDVGQIIPHPTGCRADMVAHNSPYGPILELREDATVIDSCAQSLWFVKSSGMLQNGRGYSLSDSAITLSFRGVVNNGDIVFSGLTRQAGDLQDGSGNTTTGGWHLVGNPYPSPIVLQGSDLTAMGFDAQIQLYNSGTWLSHDPAGSVVIAVGQSFQIRKSSEGGNANFTFTNAMRVAANPAFYKPTASREHYVNITIEDASSRQDKTMVYFMDDAQDGFDAQYDANRLWDGGDRPMVYTWAGKERMSFNALPTLAVGEQKSVPLSVRVEAGSAKLRFDDVNTTNAIVILEDKKLNTQQRIIEGYQYPFTVAANDSRDRFVLHFTGSFPTEVASVEDASQIALFPNPATGDVTLVLDINHDYHTATVWDMSGRAVQLHSLSQAQLQTLSVSALPAGVYFICLTGSETTTLRLIKQ